jgi:hypothetical protein
MFKSWIPCFGIMMIQCNQWKFGFLINIVQFFVFMGGSEEIINSFYVGCGKQCYGRKINFFS